MEKQYDVADIREIKNEISFKSYIELCGRFT